MTAWDPAWFAASAAAHSMQAWRGVEAQHVVATLRLVDTAAEQGLLEELLETSKPALPMGAPQHYLLATPFRYSPRHASRFRPALHRGQWYGAGSMAVACAEVAYWRHRFILDSVGLLGQELLTEHSFFLAHITGRSIDLTASPWVQSRDVWVHSTDYTGTQALAQAAQGQGVQWLAYESARAAGGRCAVVFDPAALHEPEGGLDATQQTWHCKATRSAVIFTRGRERWQWAY